MESMIVWLDFVFCSSSFIFRVCEMCSSKRMFARRGAFWRHPEAFHVNRYQDRLQNVDLLGRPNHGIPPSGKRNMIFSDSTSPLPRTVYVVNPGKNLCRGREGLSCLPSTPPVKTQKPHQYITRLMIIHRSSGSKCRSVV